MERKNMRANRGVTVLLIAVGSGFAGPAVSQSIKTETIEYHDDLAKWTLGQVKRSTTNGIEVTRTDFNANAQPIRTYAFNKPQPEQTLTYNTDGTLATASDGRDGVGGAETTITLSNWKRGIPQSIRFPATTESPAGATESAVVDDDGTIGSVTDENGYKTCYEYDAMGRVIKITYPSETQVGVCDTSTWTPTTITFAGGNTGAYGMPAGHWRQTVLTGNGRKVLILDALWRPVVEQDLDLGDVSNTVIEIVRQYDAAGRLKFQSYPMNTVGQVNYASTTLTGTRNTYDSLDRLRIVAQDSELGSLTTTTDYLNDANGPYAQVTNPRGYVTRTWFQLFDQPVYDKPETIAHPEGAFTHITRDVFGKPTALRRSNSSSPTSGTIAVNRDYTYNAYQELCRTTEPEAGATLMGYDTAGNLAWSAYGLPATTACDAEGDTTAILARKASRTYDARNRVKTLSFPNGVGNQSWTYTPDGLPDTVTTNNSAGGTQVVNSYQYNKRRLLVDEAVSQPGWYTWHLFYGFNANGHLSALTYPNTTAISLAPNALGQPTQAGVYATGVSYYPNGAIKQLTYGNGIVHTLSQNVRGLPDVSKDTYGTTSFLDDGYDFDANANAVAITDGATNRNQRGNRTMTYDGLDRLKKTVSPMYGTVGANYTYDVLDNLTQVNIGGTKARNEYYCYGSDWRLTFVRNGPVCTGTSASPAVHALEYDLQGNLQQKDGQVFSFDFGNRLRSVGSLESYRYDGHGRRVLANNAAGNIVSQYSYTGQLFFQSDVRVGLSKAYIYLGGSLVGVREQPLTGGTATIKYQHTDALGSPVAVTDASRNVLERNEYEPYGKVIAPAAPKDGPGYTGHVFDAATGMNYMQQRYYDPSLGRFLSVDPVTADGSTGGNFNRYWYANNNPYNNVDPDGRQSHPLELIGYATEMRATRYVIISQYNKGALDGPGAISMMNQLVGPDRPFTERVRNDLRANVRALENARNRGVDRAWSEERTMVRKTGTGTREWTEAEREELKATGRVAGYVGHHINNVNDFPELAADSNNVTFVDRDEHLQAHGGNWSNKTSGPMLNRGVGRFTRETKIGSRIIIRLKPGRK